MKSFVSTVFQDTANTLHIWLPHFVGPSIGMADFFSKKHAFSANIALCHPSHLLAMIFALRIYPKPKNFAISLEYNKQSKATTKVFYQNMEKNASIFSFTENSFCYIIIILTESGKRLHVMMEMGGLWEVPRNRMRKIFRDGFPRKRRYDMQGQGRLENDLGKIYIDNDVIANYAGSIAIECFGIVGMAAVNMKDGLVKLLKKDYLSHGINVRVGEDNAISLDFHCIVSYGIGIATVADNLRETVKYKVEEFTGMTVESIQVFVDGIRVID